jgi:hypothetical protein
MNRSASWRWWRRCLATAGLCHAAAVAVASTDSYISVDWQDTLTTTAQTVNLRRKSIPVRVVIAQNDLFRMTNFTWSIRRSSANGSSSSSVEEIVYEKTQSTWRTTASGRGVETWHGTVIVNRRRRGAKSSSSSSVLRNMGFATLLRYDDNNQNLVATVTTDSTIYELGRWSNGTTYVQSTLWASVPDGEGVEVSDRLEPVPRNNLNKSNSTRNSTLHVAGSFQPEADVTMSTSHGRAAVVMSDSDGRRLNVFDRTVTRTNSSNSRLVGGGSGSRNSAVVIDVLVLATNRAVCQVAGLSSSCTYSDATVQTLLNKLALAVEQTNVALSTVNVAATIRIVSVKVLTATFDANPDVAALEVLRRDPQIRAWMTESGADLVALLTGSIPTGFPAAGSAYIDRPESVVSVDYLAAYTFTHEIGTKNPQTELR